MASRFSVPVIIESKTRDASLSEAGGDGGFQFYWMKLEKHCVLMRSVFVRDN